MMAWAVWYEICKRTHATSRQPTYINIDWAISLLDIFRKTSLVCEPSNPSMMLIRGWEWMPPLQNQIRLDVDAGIDGYNNQCSVGAIVRDHQGFVVGANACVIRYTGSVKGAKLVAIRFGMDFRWVYQHLHLLGFSRGLQTVTNPVEEFGPKGAIALEIRSLVFCSIKRMRRISNGDAHHLARTVLSSNLKWLNGDIPSL